MPQRRIRPLLDLDPRSAAADDLHVLDGPLRLVAKPQSRAFRLLDPALPQRGPASLRNHHGVAPVGDKQNLLPSALALG